MDSRLRRVIVGLCLCLSGGLIGLVWAGEDPPAAADRAAGDKAATRAPEQVFAELDRNGDGRLSADEVPAERRAMFDRLLRIANKDKGASLTRAEFVDAVRANRGLSGAPGGGPAGGPRGPGGGFDPERFFQRLDKNQDGKLTLDELPEPGPPGLRQLFSRLKITEMSKDEFLKQAPTVLPPTPMAGFMRNPEQMFRGFNPDANGNVTVARTPVEYRPLVERWLDRLGRKRDESLTLEDLKRIAASGQVGGPGLPMERRATDPEAPTESGGLSALLLRRLDADDNGTLSREELQKAGDLFAELDRNRDGQLDPDELLHPPGPPAPGASPPGTK